jgi:hypothetical protein
MTTQKTQNTQNLTTTEKDKQTSGSGKPTAAIKPGSKDRKNTTSTPEGKSKSGGVLFDETSRRVLDRRPRFEKDYQKDLTFYLAKACEYLPWRFYVEFEVNCLGQQRFIDLVLKTQSPQHILMELKKGTVTVDIINEILDRQYVEGYKQRTKNGKYPMLYIIGSQFEPEAEDYAARLNEEWNWQFKRYKYKPQVQVRTYSKLMGSLDSKLMGTDIGGFELDRVRRDVPLLYESNLS